MTQLYPVTGLHSRDVTAELIKSGKWLLLAGDEALLAALPVGNWIGGTIPYFMAAEGGLRTADRVFVTEFPGAESATIRSYDRSTLPRLAADHPGHGFTVLLIPAFTAVHAEFAENVSNYPGVFDRPLVGWISGVALEDIGQVKPRVFDGTTGTSSGDRAVALHVALAPHNIASVEIINLFAPGSGDTITFTDSSTSSGAGFSVSEAQINGKPANLARYLTERAIDTRLPLVADYNGAMINVSIQKVDAAAGTVDFYAPVFSGTDYHIAGPVDDYVAGFAAQVHSDSPAPAFACNCILNYVYAELENRTTAPLTGPMTFGEIAYMLLNQTAVYLTISRDG
jgi:hypothetical protein